MKKAIKIITETVAQEYDVKLVDLCGKSQEPTFVRPRHVVFYLCRKLTTASYPVMARAFGRHHTSVLNAIRRIEALRQTDSNLHCRLLELETRLSTPVQGAIAEAKPKPVLPKYSKAVPPPPPPPPAPPQTPPPPPAPTLIRKTSREEKVSQRAQHLQTFPFDATERPSAGTACRWCAEDGHWCAASGFSGDEALCTACGNSRSCSQAEAVQRLHSGVDAPERLVVGSMHAPPRLRRTA